MQLDLLRNKIIETSQKYYAGEESGISDEEFDAMIYQLEELSPGDELLQKIASGYAPKADTSGEKVKHKYQTVGSLNKINAETCEKYFAQRPGQYVITSKIDGGSVVCYYGDEGRFDKAITRGDGNIGIDCTSKLKHIVPSTVTLTNVAVRGEIIMSKTFFELNYPDAASPRNTALGIIGKDDPTPEEISRLSFVAYNMYGNGGINTDSRKSDIMQWLQANGFTTATYTKLFDRDPRFLESMKGKLNPEFPADGLVITNELDRWDEIAYKFVAETAETTVTDVAWETSRLGNVIPVVHFNPVKLSGARLSKFLGCNARWIINKELGKGAKIIIHRAGEVIPGLVKVITPSKTILPSDCPVCNTPIKWRGVHIYCPNDQCPSKIQSGLLHWIKKMAPVDSLGENILVPFLRHIKWSSIKDIYTQWKWNDFVDNFIPGYTTHACDLLWKMYDKLYKDPVNPDKFFAAFGLPSVGETISKKISNEIGIHRYFEGEFPYDKVMALSRITKPAIESLCNNYAVMKSVYHQIMDQQGFVEREESKMEIKVAITGKLSKPRKELTEEFATHGIEVIGSITKECDYLITDDPTSGSTKNLAAKKMGVTVLSESDFRSELSIP